MHNVVSVAGLERITTGSVAKRLTLSRHTNRETSPHNNIGIIFKEFLSEMYNDTVKIKKTKR